MMSARACHEEASRLGEHYQLAINAFVDEFRRADVTTRAAMLVTPLASTDKLAALVAAVVSSLAREANIRAPSWTSGLASPEPFFVLPAKGFAMRVRLMLESPPPFRNRRVFVPENYLSRA
jgi:hypothetical protein